MDFFYFSVYPRNWEMIPRQPAPEEAFGHVLLHYRLLEQHWRAMLLWLNPFTIRTTLALCRLNRNSLNGKKF